jgi:zona occludens toxin (predicted ATPase)
MIDDKLRNDLILLAVTIVVGFFAWALRGMFYTLKELTEKSGKTVTVEDLSRTMTNIHEKVNAVDRRVAVLEDWRHRT